MYLAVWFQDLDAKTIELLILSLASNGGDGTGKLLSRERAPPPCDDTEAPGLGGRACPATVPLVEDFRVRVTGCVFTSTEHKVGVVSSERLCHIDDIVQAVFARYPVMKCMA